MDIFVLAEHFKHLAAQLSPEARTAVFFHPSLDGGEADFAGARILTEDLDLIKHQFASAEWNERLFICFREPDIHDKFDLILCAGVFSASPDPFRVLEEVARLAGAGGRVLIAEPLDWFGASALESLKKRIKTSFIRAELGFESSSEESGWFIASASQRGALLDQFFHDVELQAIRWNLKHYFAPFISEWLAKGKRRIAFWGAGEQFESITEQIFPLPEGLEVAGVVDSDAKLAGSKVCGHVVRDVADLTEMAPDVVVVASQYYQDEIVRRLDGMGLGEKAFCIYADETLRRSGKAPMVVFEYQPDTDRPTVIVTCQAATMPLIKRLRCLKNDRNFNLILLTYQGFADTQPGRELAAQCDIVKTFRNYGELKVFLESISADVIHAFTHPTHIPAICLKWGRAPVIVEMYDTLRPIWEEATVPKADLEAEKFNCENAAVIIHKDDPLPVEWLAREYGVIAPRVQIMPGIDRAECVEIDRESALPDEGPIRLVIAGTIWTSDQPARKWAYGQYIRWIPALLEQGLHVDIYSPYKRPEDKISDYLALQNEKSGFNWHEPLDYSELNRVLGEYHFGLNILFYRGTTVRPFNYSSAISTKLFSYIEAGIPVIINKEHTAMVEIVERYDIGLVIGEEDIPRLRSIIESCDYQGMKRNMNKAREELDVRFGAGTLRKIYSDFFATEKKA